MIRTEQLAKSFQDGRTTHQVLQSVSLSLGRGESLAICGQSGCGKSTLLHLLAALDRPDSGTITVFDSPLESLSERQRDDYRRRHVGIIFQQFNLIQCLNVWENVCFSQRLTQQNDPQYAEYLLATLDIQRFRHAMPDTLSGGEKQRVAIARALAHRPALILADEPTGNLDEQNSQQVARLLLECCARTNTTLLLATHSQQLSQQTQYCTHLIHGRLEPLQ